jgi:amino acid adenylation domain-containing protein
LPGVESIVGLFINTLPARISVTPSANLITWLQEIQRRQIETREHEHTPLPQIQQWSDVPAGTPLFESILVLENYTAESAANRHGEGIVVQDVGSVDQTNYPLTVVVTPERELSLLMSFDSHRFAAPAVERMLANLGALLERMVARPDQPLSAFPLIGDAEREQILRQWNDTAFEYDRALDVPQRVGAWARRTPHALAVAAGAERLTFGELDARAEALATRLRRLGVGQETRVGLCVPRSTEMVVGMLGILKAGGAYVPLDPTHPRERLAFMLDDAGVSILLTRRDLAAQVPERPVTLYLDDGADDAAHLPPRVPHPLRASPDSLAYVIYTSGSTGRPKGVEVSRGALTNRVAWYGAAYGVTPQDRASQFLSVAFDVCGWEVWPHLAAGASVHVVEDAIRSSPRELQRWLLQERITISNLPTTLAEAMLGLDWPAGAPLRWIQTGGEKLQRRPPPGLPFRLVNNYGPTENTVTSTWYPVLPGAETAEPIAIGTPLGNTRAYLVDPHGQLVPVGVPGELLLAGESLARGYAGRPALTAARFVPDPFGTTPGGRLYRTGDLARYLPSGDIEFLGRIDQQVKIRGHRVELGEIEALLDTHPTVREAVVVVPEVDPPQLVAYVTPRDGQAPDGAGLRAFLKERLPAYMVPGAFVTLDALPLNSSGKVDHKRLPAPPPQTREDVSRSAPFVAPRTDLEEVVAGVWATVLGLALVGVEDDFFELGGHSLLATRVMSQVHDVFRLDLPMRVLFEAPTVAGMAEALVRHEPLPGHVSRLARRYLETGAPPDDALSALRRRDARLIVPRTRPPHPEADRAPLSFAQQRLWFLDQLEPGGTTYIIPDVFRLHGALDAGILERSLQALVDRHESLRTTFAVVDGRPVQVIAPTVHLALPRVDLRTLPAPEREARLLALAGEEARRPFDLAQGPLIRATLIQLAEAEHALFLTMHHIVTDGWSMGIFVRELTALYTALAQGAASPPWPQPSLHYADFAAWQQEWLRGAVLDEQVAYWTRQLTGAPFVLDLPADRPRPATQTYRAGTVSLTLPPRLGATLKAFSQEQGATLFMTLFAAFTALLSRYTGQKDILVGTTIANRNRSELEGIVGFFVNTLVLRADLSGNPTFRTLLHRVREMCLDAYAHQDVPFEKVVEALQPERDLSRTPLFQVMFALQNAPMDGWELPGLTVRSLDLPLESTAFDLDVEFREGPDGLTGTFVYDRDLFEHATIARMADHLQTMLEGLVAAHDLRVGELPLLTPPEQAALAAGNATGAPYPAGRGVHQLVAAQAARAPQATALVHGGQRLTYGQLDARAEALATRLRARGVGPDVLVALCLERSPGLIVALLAVLKAGGAYVPLDPAYPPDHLAFMVEDSQAPLILTQERLRHLFPATGAAVLCLDEDGSLIDTGDPQVGSPRGAGASSPDARPFAPDSLAYVIYTSGSTGRPKGVMIQHR